MPIGSHISIHMKSWPNVKLGQVQLCSNITHLAHWKSYLVIICPNSHQKSTKSEIRSSYYLLQFGFIYPYLAQKYNFCPYLALLIFTTIYLYLAVFRLNYPYFWVYLPLIALILPYVPYSPYTCILLLRLHLCKILEQSDHYSWR